MDIKYLEYEINRLDIFKSTCELSSDGEEKLIEFKAIKQALNIQNVSVLLLKKFMEHTFNCSGTNYVSDIKQPWSGVKFSKEEALLLEMLQKEIDPEQ
jgi:hypothetical protein